MRFATVPAVSWMCGALLVGCGSDDAAETDPHSAVADVVFPDLATDEALLRLLSVAPMEHAERRLSFEAPLDVDGAVLASDAPVAFAWALPATARNAGESVAPRRGSEPGPRDAIRALVRFFEPISTAHAHGAPFNGTGYFLTFSPSGNGKPALRVFTAAREYMAEPARWATFAASGSPWTLSITYAHFENNEMVAGGGPFAGGAVSFSVD